MVLDLELVRVLAAHIHANVMCAHKDFLGPKLLILDNRIIHSWRGRGAIPMCVPHALLVLAVLDKATSCVLGLVTTPQNRRWSMWWSAMSSE